jgi:predicted transcriptional regulator
MSQKGRAAFQITNPKTIQTVVEHAGTKSIREIARMIGHDKCVVERIFREHGLKSKFVLTDKEEQQILDLFDELGAYRTINTIAKRVGRDWCVVHRVGQKHGLL